jgi:hypothetical protein
MALFRKSAEPASSSATTAVVPYESRPQPSMGPKATDLERRIRSQIWQHMSPELAHAADLTLAELIDFTSGATRLSKVQLEALGRKMGLLEDLPPTGIDLVRRRLRVMMKKWPNFVSHFEWRHGEQALQNFLEGDSLAHAQVEFLARAFFGDKVSIDPVTAELRWPANVAEPTGPPPPNHRGGSNVPSMNQMAIATYKRLIAELERVEAS